ISAAKSAAEAIDQGWKPNTPQTMFSPAFIYPQLNKGKDDGSSPIKAALLLIEKGAATLKTTPYVPKDFKTQPSAFAFEEALRFKNKDAYLLKDPDQIRLCLRENLPVVIGARLTPNFFDGRFERYTPELHKEGMKKRLADQPHAMHAMVIVGYDDPSRRFLLRNSWGENWGKGGYCWVDYDVIKTIDPSPESEAFLFVALAMVDELADAEATPDVGEDQKDALRLAIHGEPAGFDLNFAKTKYRFTADVRGPKVSLDLIKEVRWAVPTWNGKVKTLLAKNPERGFRVLSSVGGEVHDIVAAVLFKDGSTREYKVTTAFEPMRADDRPITLTSDDFYYGKRWMPKLNRMADSWTRVVHVEGPSQDIHDIKTMTLQVGDDAPEGLGPHGQIWEVGNIYLHETECRPLRLHLTFADGTQTDRVWDIPEFEDPLDDGIWMKKVIRPVGDGAQSAYTLSVRAPVGLFIDSVDWELDGTQSHFKKSASASEWRGYPVSGSAYRDFRARATVRFSELENRPDVVLEEWIELPDDGTAYATPKRVEVRQESTYLGRDGKDRPEWSYDLRLTGDWQATREVQGATFAYVDMDGSQQSVPGTRQSNGDWTAELRNVSADLQVTTDVQFADGPLELRDTFHSDKPIVDGVFLETRTSFVWNYTFRDKIDWSVRVGGSHWHTAIEKVAWMYDALLDEIPAKDWREEKERNREPHAWQTIHGIHEGP
ncbi:MAG: hypothetical protein KDB61_08470, partial [Planctomycetes bacterium]|nr:hypothetical protein [Planctomycetota bacterium]